MQLLESPEIDVATLLSEDDSDMAITIATLEERVNNHIKFFWTVVAVGFAWLTVLTGLILQTKSKVADLPLDIGAALVSTAKREAASGHIPQAVSAMESATAIIDAAQQRRVRPSPAFFTKQIEAISHFPPATPTQLSGQVNEFRFSLATYRSLFNPKPVIPRKVEEWKPGEEVKPFVTFHISGPEAQWVLPPKVQVLAGPEKSVTFDAYNLGDKDLFVPSSRSMEDSQNVVDYVTVLGGSQTLDGIDWKNVTFVNVHIKYTGGSMRLRNVKFVNCTFDLPNDKYGAQIADYVALDSKDLWM